GHHAAHGGTAGEVRRLEGQALAAFGQYRFQLGQRSARTRGDDEFGRLVAGDAGERRGFQQFALQLFAVEILAAAAADAQQRASVAGGADAPGQLIRDEFHCRPWYAWAAPCRSSKRLIFLKSIADEIDWQPR